MLIGQIIKRTASNVIKYINQITNGNMVNTTGWTPEVSTLSATNNVLSVIGNGSAAFPNVRKTTNIPITSSQKIFLQATIRAKNSLCTNLLIQAGGTVGGSSTNVSNVSNPIENEWYTLNDIFTPATQTGSIVVRITNIYGSNAITNGKVMEIREVIAYDVTDFPVEHQTTEWCSANIAPNIVYQEV